MLLHAYNAYHKDNRSQQFYEHENGLPHLKMGVLPKFL